MKKLLVAALLLIFTIPAGSVLKEKDLARTLGVLKAELQATYEQQQTFMQNYEHQAGAPPHDDHDVRDLPQRVSWRVSVGGHA